MSEKVLTENIVSLIISSIDDKKLVRLLKASNIEEKICQYIIDNIDVYVERIPQEYIANILINNIFK